jgi:dolichol-phosphate mannosyltransferase
VIDTKPMNVALEAESVRLAPNGAPSLMVVSPTQAPRIVAVNEFQYSILIMARNEASNLAFLLPQIRSVLAGQGCTYEIIVVDGASSDETVSTAEAHGASVFLQKGKGYGSAFREGLTYCRGEWIITLDADYSHPPQFLRALISQKEGVDMLIASRYVPGGDAKMEFYRNFLSKILSFLFGRFLGIPVKDVSSGFRMYRRSVVSRLGLEGRDFDVLIETLVRVVSKGYRVREIPFIYEPRVHGRSNARVFKFALSYLRTLRRAWNLRNSVDAADYEERAYNSWIPLQRYWQRRRMKLTLSLAEKNVPTLDIGSGASRTARSLPCVTAVDVNPNPLRFLGGCGIPVVQGSLAALPFKSSSFQQVILGEVIQQITRKEFSLDEIVRVLRPGGTLILSTPNYASALWRVLERWYLRILPHAPGTLHLARYTQDEVVELLNKAGFTVTALRLVLGADLVCRAQLRNRDERQEEK